MMSAASFFMKKGLRVINRPWKTLYQ